MANKGKKRTEVQKQFMKERRPDMSGTNNPNYGKHHTMETKKKISEKSKLRVGAKNSFYGKHHTAETKAKISKACKGKKISQEHKDKISMKIICVETGIIYRSQVEASLLTGFSSQAIRKSIKTGMAIGHNRFTKEADKVHFKIIEK